MQIIGSKNEYDVKQIRRRIRRTATIIKINTSISHFSLAFVRKSNNLQEQVPDCLYLYISFLINSWLLLPYNPINRPWMRTEGKQSVSPGTGTRWAVWWGPLRWPAVRMVAAEVVVTVDDAAEEASGGVRSLLPSPNRFQQRRKRWTLASWCGPTPFWNSLGSAWKL